MQCIGTLKASLCNIPGWIFKSSLVSKTCITLITLITLKVTQEASGNIWAPIIIFANSPLSDQTIVDQQVAEIFPDKCKQSWIKLFSKAALMVERKAAAIPAPPEEAVEVFNI